ncbi:hypothetical protein [Dinghuibacter silviterrae]|uniref:Uncharacterized protein n=1 Tax=Dinghuibacter silviterrae TaxID=1539049 RepID=A0A4R8DW13_9BACT|nr:hypothetical protein [Dinghuibacter silviterrae]TDX02256.1 hypothetical protein EDB95_3311 [Dinghuibacter silviterrae]
MRVSRIRIVLDGKDIYPIGNEKVVIDVDHNNPVLVVTDGFHISRPLELVYYHLNTYYFRVECGMDDGQLIAGLALTMLFFLTGMLTRWWIFGVLSFGPVLYILFLYYIKRKDFLSLRPM